MDRRGFLKGAAAVGVTPLLPPAVLTNLVAPVAAEIPAVTVADFPYAFYTIEQHKIFKNIATLLHVDVNAQNISVTRVKSFNFTNFRHIKIKHDFFHEINMYRSRHKDGLYDFIGNYPFAPRGKGQNLFLDSEFNIVNMPGALEGYEISKEKIPDERELYMFYLIDRHAC